MSSPALIDSMPARVMTWFALAILLATDGVYILLTIGQQGTGPDVVSVVFVAGYLLVMAALLLASLVRLRRQAWRMPLRAAAAGGLLVLGILSLFSIGVPLVIAGALATGATVRTLRGPFVTASSLSGVVAAVIAVAVLVAGFEATQRLIVCPSHGSLSGSGSALVTGEYYYDCSDGRLTMHSGSCTSTSIDANGNVTHPGC